MEFLFSFFFFVWNFCGKSNVKLIESLQERALRFVYNDSTSSYESLLRSSKTESLQIQRLRAMALQVFKCINKIGPSYLHDLFESKDTNYHLRDSNVVKQDKYFTVKYGFLSFKYHGAKIWNNLPANIKTTTNFKDFKYFINTWEGPYCKCHYCCL